MTNLHEAAQALRAMLEGRQYARLLRLSFPNGDGPKAMLVANRLDGFEALSRDFQYTVEVLADDARIPLKDVLGKMVTLSLVREDGSLRYFNGYVFEFRLSRVDGGFAFYQLTLAPWLAFLRQRRDNYLFHGKTLLDCTRETFADYPQQSVAFRISGPDPLFTDACQYEESDYNHLHRRWEAQGWFYFYEHHAKGHTLVLCDDSTQLAPIDGTASIPFQDMAGSLEDDGIHEWVPVRRFVPSKVALSSFDFKQPRPMQAELPTLNQQGDVPQLEIYDYAGAYAYANQAEGDAQARLRMEEFEAQGKCFEAAGNDRAVQPGRCFTLSEHFDIGDEAFLVVEAQHQASNNYLMDSGEPAQYRNRLRCVRKAVPWRPGRGLNSQQPRIYGVQTAIVVGPAGEEILTDEYGRVRVQFHWDRVGGYDENSSAWVRVASTWAGSNFGFVAIPRIGQEVLVQFLDGNPDRPLITGRVYNQDNMPPWDLPANKTQTGILTRSSSGGGYDNANAIRFEDKKGQEELWLHAEKDQRIEVENDESHWVGHDRQKTVDHDETVHVKHNRTETVDNDETITVHNNRSERVDHNETISIGDNRSETVGQNETISIGQNQTVHIGDNRSVTIGGNKTETIALAKAETIGLAKALTIGAAYQTTVGGLMNTTVALMQTEQVGLSKQVDVAKKFNISAGDEFTVTVGKSQLSMKSDGTIILKGVSIQLEASKDQQYTAKGNITLKARKILEN